jgi:hypothetical protein
MSCRQLLPASSSGGGAQPGAGGSSEERALRDRGAPRHRHRETVLAVDALTSPASRLDSIIASHRLVLCAAGDPRRRRGAICRPPRGQHLRKDLDFDRLRRPGGARFKLKAGSNEALRREIPLPATSAR